MAFGKAVAGAALAIGLIAAGGQARAADLAPQPAVPSFAAAPQDTWYVQAGLASVNFYERARVSAFGTEIPGARARVGDGETFALGVGYFFTPNISAIGIIGYPPTTTISGTGAIAGLTAGRVQYGPAVAALNYHFRNFGAFQPFVGVGVNYTLIFDTTDGDIQRLKVNNALGPVLRVGFDYMLTDKLGLFFSYNKVFVGTKLKGFLNPAIPGLGGARVTGKIDLDPAILHTGLTYRF
ncbi:MAG: outer membrane beta-barrel protein [Methylorubrum populi]